MHKSKLLYTLKLFSREELYLLSDFLRSPYLVPEANQRAYLPLFQYIVNFFGNWEHPDLDKTIAFKKVYPEEEMTKGKMDKLMSALLKEIHRFIALHFKENKEDSLREMVTLIQFFRKRDEHKSVIHYLEKAKKKLQHTPIQGRPYYFNSFLIGKEITQRHVVEDSNRFKLDHQSVFQPLDAFYLINKLEQACFLLSQHRFRRPVDLLEVLDFLDTVKPLYIRNGLLEIPLIKIYYFTYELLKKNNDESEGYEELKVMIEQYESTIPLESLKVLTGLLRNFIIEQHNRGFTQRLEEIFDLHRSHLEKGYLNFDKGILPSVFKNMVTIGLRVKAYDWVFQFLKKYKNKLEGTITPQDVYDYNLASYYFNIKEYDKSIALLADQYKDIFYKIAAKRLELKIYYETSSDLLDAKMDAFKVYIFRLPKRAILERKRASNNHFINFLRQLRNPRTIHSPQRLQKLHQKIKDTSLLTEKNWLLEKVTEC